MTTFFKYMHAFHADEEEDLRVLLKEDKTRNTEWKLEDRFRFDVRKNFQHNKEIRNVGYGTQNTWIRTPTPPPGNCMVWGRLTCSNNNSTYLIKLWEAVHAKCLEQCLAQSIC